MNCGAQQQDVQHNMHIKIPYLLYVRRRCIILNIIHFKELLSLTYYLYQTCTYTHTQRPLVSATLPVLHGPMSIVLLLCVWAAALLYPHEIYEVTDDVAHCLAALDGGGRRCRKVSHLTEKKLVRIFAHIYMTSEWIEVE